jgi:hypothetical protein
MEGKYVELIKDVTDKGKYGRLLRHVILPQPDENNALDLVDIFIYFSKINILLCSQVQSKKY